MASLDMLGPYPFTTEGINQAITNEQAGNYVIGFIDNNKFVPKYVGRSDSDVKSRLKSHLGKHPTRYNCFKFSYASSPKSAFEKECQNYHDLKHYITNQMHPDQPNNHSKVWKCPKADCDYND